jgi:hypothetical protein
MKFFLNDKIAVQLNRLPFINELLRPLLKVMFFAKQIDRFGFKGTKFEVCPFEGR